MNIENMSISNRPYNINNFLINIQFIFKPVGTHNGPLFKACQENVRSFNRNGLRPTHVLLQDKGY